LPTNFQRAFPPFHLDPTCTYFVGTRAVAGDDIFASEDIECGETIIVERPFLMVVAGSPENFADQTKLMPMVTRASDVVLAQHLSEGEQTNFRRLLRVTNRTIEVMNQNSILIIWIRGRAGCSLRGQKFTRVDI
jgi:hypothetical protein